MSKPKRSSSLDDLGDRIKDVQAKRRAREPKGPSGGAGTSGLGVGLRMATEIVAAIIVGTGVGLVLDTWLGTKPWLMVLFLMLGCAAALMNVMRAGKEMERRAKEERDAGRADKGADADRDEK